MYRDAKCIRRPHLFKARFRPAVAQTSRPYAAGGRNGPV